MPVFDEVLGFNRSLPQPNPYANAWNAVFDARRGPIMMPPVPEQLYAPVPPPQAPPSAAPVPQPPEQLGYPTLAPGSRPPGLVEMGPREMAPPLPAPMPGPPQSRLMHLLGGSGNWVTPFEIDPSGRTTVNQQRELEMNVGALNPLGLARLQAGAEANRDMAHADLYRQQPLIALLGDLARGGAIPPGGLQPMAEQVRAALTPSGGTAYSTPLGRLTQAAGGSLPAAPVAGAPPETPSTFLAELERTQGRPFLAQQMPNILPVMQQRFKPEQMTNFMEPGAIWRVLSGQWGPGYGSVPEGGMALPFAEMLRRSLGLPSGEDERRNIIRSYLQGMGPMGAPPPGRS